MRSNNAAQLSGLLLNRTFRMMTEDAAPRNRNQERIMRAMKWAIGMAFLLTGAIHLSAKDDEAVDLRGPAPKKGEVTVSKSVFKIKNANFVLKIAGQTLEGKQTLIATE